METGRERAKAKPWLTVAKTVKTDEAKRPGKTLAYGEKKDTRKRGKRKVEKQDGQGKTLANGGKAEAKELAEM